MVRTILQTTFLANNQNIFKRRTDESNKKNFNLQLWIYIYLSKYCKYDEHKTKQITGEAAFLENKSE